MAWFRREDEIYWDAKKIVVSLSISLCLFKPWGLSVKSHMGKEHRVVLYNKQPFTSISRHLAFLFDGNTSPSLRKRM